MDHVKNRLSKTFEIRGTAMVLAQPDEAPVARAGADSRPDRVGIDQVAFAAGVSRQTVSNVINDQGRFAPTTRDRVLSEVARLGYRPHRAARSLRSRRSMQLALPLSPALLRSGNIVMAQFLQACIAAAAARDHHVLVSADVDGRTDGIRQLIATASVDAFLLADVNYGDPRVAILLDAGVPFACFGRTRPDQPQCWVDVDNVGAVREVVAHLVALGHRELAYVGYSGPDFWNLEREQGFVGGVRAAGLPVDPRRIRRVREATVHAAVDALLSRRVPPKAIVTGSDALASAVYSVAAGRGLQVGRDLAVTGVDGSALARVLVPSLTTVAIPLDQIARMVVDRALNPTTDPAAPGIMVRGELIVGGSTVAPMPRRPTLVAR